MLLLTLLLLLLLILLLILLLLLLLILLLIKKNNFCCGLFSKDCTIFIHILHSSYFSPHHHTPSLFALERNFRRSPWFFFTKKKKRKRKRKSKKKERGKKRKEKKKRKREKIRTIAGEAIDRADRGSSASDPSFESSLLE